jgi:NAD(P)-dependent dehydrogenase (short-subunit alcohol dehydrogenase family)
VSSGRRWVLILGVSSGFGAAAAQAYAEAGWHIIGVHLDRRATLPAVEALRRSLEEAGAEILLFNGNAASDDFRSEVVAAIAQHLEVRGGTLSVVLHSLAFGTLTRLVPGEDEQGISRRQLEMTMDVMAHSLVYWARDLVAADLLRQGRIFAMTSEGSQAAWDRYGAVAAAKAALESHVRQLGRELAERKVTANAILAGVTQTPALEKIPGADLLKDKARAKNPNGRLTRPHDVAAALVALSAPSTYWLNSNVIRIDGGESSCA